MRCPVHVAEHGHDLIEGQLYVSRVGQRRCLQAPLQDDAAIRVNPQHVMRSGQAGRVRGVGDFEAAQLAAGVVDREALLTVDELGELRRVLGELQGLKLLR